MTESASDMLKKMRDDKKKDTPTEKIKKGDPEGFYVKLIVNTLRKRQITLATIFGFFLFALIIGTNMNYSRDWTISCLPIAIIGFMICLIPPTEEWEYKPWQARPRQYERHQVEKS